MHGSNMFCSTLKRCQPICKFIPPPHSSTPMQEDVATRNRQSKVTYRQM